MKFDYKEAFSRNIGWLTDEEQEKLRNTRVAIAGMGGVGGNYLLTLARLGVGRFHIADFDKFEVANFNRQVGSSVSHLGQSKIEVMENLARDINPELEIVSFPNGLNEENLPDFLEGVDVYVDGLDAFCLQLREPLFAKAHQLGIHAMTIAPLGMGAALVNIDPNGTSFEEHFGFSLAQNDIERSMRFFVGFAPKMLHLPSLVVPDRLDFAKKIAPSTFMGCQLCAGVAGTEVLKLVTKRGPIYSAPYAIHFDAFSYRYKIARVIGGYKNPLQKLKYEIGVRQLRSRISTSPNS